MSQVLAHISNLLGSSRSSWRSLVVVNYGRDLFLHELFEISTFFYISFDDVILLASQ